MILCKEEYKKQIDKTIFPGIQGGPLMHVIAAKAVAFGEALSEEFKTYSEKVIANAKKLASALEKEGINLVSNGTDNHLVLLDLQSLDMTGKVAEKALDDIGITTNKNTIPFDPQSPFVTSGLRIGTAAVTSRGFGEAEMEEIASIIGDVLKHHENEDELQKAEKRVQELTDKFPMYESISY